MAFVYILACGDGTLYTGAAADWKLRLKEHCNGKGATYTRGRQPLTVVFLRETAGWPEALKEEERLTKQTNRQKEKLIAAFRTETAGLTETAGV